MKTLGVTQYEVINDEHGRYVQIYNGFSSCYKLFNFDKHIFSRIDGLTGNVKGSDIQNVKEISKDFDRIYCSVSTDYEYDYLYPILDERWVLGGPMIQHRLYTNRENNFPCQVTSQMVPEYFGIEEYDYSNYSTFYDKIMMMYPRRRGLVHVNVGGFCYWNKCSFCTFDTNRRPPLRGNDLIKLLENFDKSKRHYLGHLSNPALFPDQLRTVMQYSPRKKNWLQIFIRSEKEINKIFDEFDNNELENVLVGVGVETTSETIRNKILMKKMYDYDIIETIQHVVRLGGSFELSMMSNFFWANRYCVDETKKFVRRLEEVLPHEKFRSHFMDERVVTRWPLRARDWIKSITPYEIKEDFEKEFGWHYKVILPQNSDVYKYNKEMEDIYNNAKFHSKEFDMYMGDPNE